MDGYSEFTDAHLVSLLIKGDKLAYTTIYSRFWAVIYRHACKMLQDEREAEDVTQEVFFMLWNKASDLVVKTSLSGYLYISARNRIFNRLEHGKIIARYASSLEIHLESQESTTDHLIREKQLRELIEQEIDALPEQMRLAFQLSRDSHLSYKQIAEKMNISEGAVRGQITRALKQLRTKLGAFAFLRLF